MRANKGSPRTHKQPNMKQRMLLWQTQHQHVQKQLLAHITQKNKGSKIWEQSKIQQMLTKGDLPIMCAGTSLNQKDNCTKIPQLKMEEFKRKSPFQNLGGKSFTKILITKSASVMTIRSTKQIQSQRENMNL